MVLPPLVTAPRSYPLQLSCAHLVYTSPQGGWSARLRRRGPASAQCASGHRPVVPEYPYLLEYLTFASPPCILGSNHVALFLASSHKGPAYAIRLLSPDGLRHIVVSVS